MTNRIFCCTLLFLLASMAYSQLKVLHPEGLKKYWDKEEPAAAIANFGYVPWGRSLTGVVHLAEPYKACDKLDKHDIDPKDVEDPSKYPIIIAERGTCTFTQKALMAQNSGARMLIIIDTIEEPVDQTMPIGDGNEGGVHIPVLLVSKAHGNKMKEYIDSFNEAAKNSSSTTPPPEDAPPVPPGKAESVVISMFFEMPTNPDESAVELWISGTDSRSFELARDLRPLFNQIGWDRINFRPYYAIWYCPYCKENNYTTEDNENCYSGGRYCSPDPDNDGPLNGRDVLKANLRQLCVYDPNINSDTYNPSKSDKNARGWFDYMDRFGVRCLGVGSDRVKMDECHRKGCAAAGLNQTIVDKCVDDTFLEKNHNLSDNKVLSKQREMFKRRNIQVWPSVLVNSFLYRGNADAKSIYETVCESFGEKENMPQSCQNYFKRKGKADAVYGEADYEDHSLKIVVWIICVGIVFLLIAIIFYRRWIRRELMRDLNNQLNARISEYMAMQDDEKVSSRIANPTNA